MNATEACELTAIHHQKMIEDEMNLIPARIKLAVSKGQHTCGVKIFGKHHIGMIREWCKENSTDTHVYLLNSFGGRSFGELSWFSRSLEEYK